MMLVKIYTQNKAMHTWHVDKQCIIITSSPQNFSIKDQKATLLSLIHLLCSAICTNCKQLPQLLILETWYSLKPEDSNRTTEYNHFLEKTFGSLTYFPFFSFFFPFFLPLLSFPNSPPPPSAPGTQNWEAVL